MKKSLIVIVWLDYKMTTEEFLKNIKNYVEQIKVPLDQMPIAFSPTGQSLTKTPPSLVSVGGEITSQIYVPIGV